MTPSRDIARLLEIMAALRTPVSGCPWDLEQTFRSIAPYTIEEAYEVADAIERGDLAHLKDELGDLLLQVVYHSRMAEEQGAFAFGDVVEAVTTKMIRRHPHVFGDKDARAAGAPEDFWEKAKAKERAAKPAGASLLDDVPAALPALTRAVKLQDKAARVGFDWPSLAPVFDKLREELSELEAEIGEIGVRHSGSDTMQQDQESKGVRPGVSDTPSRIAEEFGDLLFVVANVARHLKLDPEAALRSANQKFVRRFRHIEARLAEQGRKPADSNLAEMDALWDEARAADKAKA